LDDDPALGRFARFNPILQITIANLNGELKNTYARGRLSRGGLLFSMYSPRGFIAELVEDDGAGAHAKGRRGGAAVCQGGLDAAVTENRKRRKLPRV
jgi:hypothetical protein